ncbi:MAG: hypothetical protein L6408_05405 [Nanoarchaeota archaeon]|nr:hypothetical protein [Nanoarchaeota archaeon]
MIPHIPKIKLTPKLRLITIAIILVTTTIILGETLTITEKTTIDYHNEYIYGNFTGDVLEDVNHTHVSGYFYNRSGKILSGAINGDINDFVGNGTVENGTFKGVIQGKFTGVITRTDYDINGFPSFCAVLLFIIFSGCSVIFKPASIKGMTNRIVLLSLFGISIIIGADILLWGVGEVVWEREGLMPLLSFIGRLFLCNYIGPLICWLILVFGLFLVQKGETCYGCMGKTKARDESSKFLFESFYRVILMTALFFTLLLICRLSSIIDYLGFLFYFVFYWWIILAIVLVFALLSSYIPTISKKIFPKTDAGVSSFESRFFREYSFKFNVFFKKIIIYAIILFIVFFVLMISVPNIPVFFFHSFVFFLFLIVIYAAVWISYYELKFYIQQRVWEGVLRKTIMKSDIFEIVRCSIPLILMAFILYSIKRLYYIMFGFAISSDLKIVTRGFFIPLEGFEQDIIFIFAPFLALPLVVLGILFVVLPRLWIRRKTVEAAIVSIVVIWVTGEVMRILLPFVTTNSILILSNSFAVGGLTYILGKKIENTLLVKTLTKKVSSN